jgi:tetratricopeptide (TPR) repeat protein
VVRQRLEGTAGAADLPAVEDVTTSSLEAWRLYSQGISLQHESRETEALPLLEQAIEIDPSFALALVAAGRIHANLNHPGRAREYTARGVELSDRLPLDQRFSIAATHYATTWSTYGRAIESFQEALRLDPEKAAWRNNLANLYAYLERYEEAERELMRLIEADTPFAPSYGTAADVLAAQGKLESGRALLEDFAARHPDNWYGQLVLGWYGIQENRPGAVEEHLAAAEALAPGNRHLEYVRWRLEILRGALDDAEGAAQRMVVQDDAYSRWRGHVSIARNRLYRGRATEALTHYDLATRAYGEPEAYTALAHTWKAELHLQLGQAEEARLEARTARRQAPGTWPELRGIFLEALAAAHLGDEATARALVDELEKRWQSQPNVVEERQLLHLKGRLALLRGDTPAALEALRKAAELLPPRGIEIHDYALPNHLPLWLALGEAELAAGNTEAALPWLTRAWESDSEHIMFPVVRMRAAFLLGRLHFERGEVEAARPVLEAYLRAWGDGDLDRGDVEAAERMLGSIRS